MTDDLIPSRDGDDADELPPAELEEQALFRRIKSWHANAKPGFEKWRKEAEEAFNFISGHQWTDEEKAKMEEASRPLVTFDRLGAVIDVVVGSEINNRQEASAKPRDKSDAPVAEVAGDVIEFLRDDADADDAEGDAFRDLLISGMGWDGLRLAEQNDRRLMHYDHVDPFEMRWPAGCRARNLGDAPWLLRIRSVDRLAAEELLPDHKWDEINAGWARSHDDGDVHRTNPDRTYQQGSPAADEEAPDRVTVVEAQWIAREDVYSALDPQTGQMAPIDAEMAQRLQQTPIVDPMTGEPGMWPVTVKKERITYRAFVGAHTVLEKVKLPTQGLGMTYICQTGKWDRKERVWYGIVRGAMDPQRYANKWLSMSVEILAAGAKGGVMYEDDAFADEEAARKDWATPSGMVKLNAGGLAKIQTRPAPQYPAGWDRLLNLALSAIRDSTGVNTELLGLRDAQQPGILEHQRKQAAVTILATYFDALRRARKQAAEIVLAMALEALTDEELARILGEEKAAIIPALRAANVLQFDIIIDESPQSANAKERTWAALSPLLPLMASMGVPAEVWAEVLRTSPLPTSFAETVIQHISKGKEPDQAGQAMQQMAMQQAAADLAEKQAKTEKTKAETVTERLEAMVLAAEAGIEAGDRIAARDAGMIPGMM